MSTRIALTHVIEQRFAHRIQLSTHWLRLRPAPHTQANISAYSLKVQAQPHFINWVRDPFENHLARLDLPEPVFDLKIVVELIADLVPVNPFDFLVDPAAGNYPFDYPLQLRKELKPYFSLGRVGPRLADWLGTLDRPSGYIVDTLDEFTRSVQEHLPVTGELRPGAVDSEAVLQCGAASAWEAAWLFTLSLRHLGLAARFTSGYRIHLAPEPAGMHAWGDTHLSAAEVFPDTAGLHAWSEIYLPGAGWIGLDPATGLFTHEGYIPLASAPDALRTLPLIGYCEACEEQCSEQVRVRRLVPAPNPSPYSETQWADLQAVGQQIDAALKSADIGLSSGITLSFVSATDASAPEWSTAALGTHKRTVAEDFLSRLWHGLGSGGIVHEGQGEWFAGEALPRWRLNCFFRADGHPIWRNPSSLGQLARSGEFGSVDAEYFGQVLASKLGVSSRFLVSAHEDQLYELWLNRAQMEYAPPAEALRDPIRRRELAASLSETRREPVGYVLPLRWNFLSESWASGRWRFRRGALYLSPGESSMGYRLPLDSLPIGEESAAALNPERCHFEERPLLPAIYGELSSRLTAFTTGPTAVENADSESPMRSGAPRTALCIQARNGRLYVFLPPLTHLEHYLDLLAAIEATAFIVGMPVMLEGYEPPEDYRLRRLALEPDAGVLKVVLPMAETWDQALHFSAVAYREAANAGLSGERIAANGRRAPPGGRSDLILGGEQPSSSPFLRHPALLHSLIAYWQQHPALSYFFAGRPIGPSSASPRPDEGRDDALYELGIALSRMPQGETLFPWIPDRALRHLLADPAGDMRRAEIRMDQLYAPDRASQRLGRITIRSFETAPDPKLAAAQLLLARGLVAFVAEHPVESRLIDWETELHDRFMLPRLLWEDLEDVLRDLNRAGYPFQAEWFEPFLNLRFPALGQVRLDDVTIELRMAHEPWPVLAEEVTSAGISRFVDTANERVQVEVSGLTPSRHVLICNGRQVPLRPTKIKGRYVAGVRYKTRNPVASLHPTVSPIASLVFDLVDTWTGRVLGGCTYLPEPSEPLGLAAVPVMITEPERTGGHQFQRPYPETPPPWSFGGRFLNTGSRLKRMEVPGEIFNSRHAYLLDLTVIG